MPQSEWIKDPDAVLDYKFDWKALTNGTGNSDWLGAGETITAHTIDEDAGITVDSSALDDGNTSVEVWLSGGTAGVEYSVRCEIETSGSRTDERTMKIKCEER